MSRDLLRLGLFVFVLLLGASGALAQSQSPLVGTWKGSFQGYPFDLQLKADGTGTITGDPIRWKVQGQSLVLTGEDGPETYHFELRGSQLLLSGGDLFEPMTLTRVGGSSAPPASPDRGRTDERGTGAAKAPGGSPAAPPPAARGGTYTHEPWGVTFAVPPSWKVGPREGVLLLGSETEPGLMIVRIARGTSLDQLVKDYGEGMSEEGVSLMPAKPAESFPAGRNKGAAGELAGTARDGARLRGRVIAVAGPYGDAAVVLGLTTEEKYQGLKPRVESLAASLSFSKPKEGPLPGFLAGQYYYISASSFGSSERYLNLCGDGSFYEGGEIYSSGDAGTAAGGSGARGRWSADGGPSQGVITVTYANGRTDTFPYRRSGTDLSVGGRTYARYGDGSCTKRSPVYD